MSTGRDQHLDISWENKKLSGHVEKESTWHTRERRFRISLDFFTVVLYMPKENGVRLLGFSRKEGDKNFVSRKTTLAIVPTL